MLTRARTIKGSTTPVENARNSVALSVISEPATLADQEEDVSDEEEVIWVQCDREECQKWRKLPRAFEISTASDWYCDMHPDPSQRSCDIPEETCNISGKKFFTFTWFPAGQLVWAKMTGYPQWPAVVTPDPWSRGEHFSIEADAEGCIYHIEFLGKPRSHIWLSERQMTPFRINQSPAPTKLNKRLTLAIKEAGDMYYLSDLERLEKCEYTKMSPSTSLETSVKLKGKHRKKNPKGTSQRLAETQPDTLKSHHHTLAQCDSSSLTTRTAQSVVITPTNHNLSSHIHKCSTKDQATDSSHNVTMHPSCISMATDYLEVSSSPQSTRECSNRHELSTKSHQIRTNPHGMSVAMEEAPNNHHPITDQNTFSHLESNVLYEWKEIETLCNVTSTRSMHYCDLGSVLTEMQAIEEFIQVINDDHSTLSLST